MIEQVMATTTVGRTGSTGASAAYVLVDGVSLPECSVASVEAAGPLDERRVVLSTPLQWPPHQLTGLVGREARVVWPVRLEDGFVQDAVLVEGPIRQWSASAEPGAGHRHLTVHDAWAQRLDRAPAEVWWSVDGKCVAQVRGEVAPGPRGNRSRERHSVGGQRVHVLQRDGDAWTAGDLLACVATLHGLEMALWLLPKDVQREVITEPVNLAGPLRAVLASLCEAHHLVLERRSARSLVVRASERRRRITLGLPVLRQRQREGASATLWRVTGGRPEVEATLWLRPAWNTALQNEPDEQYGRLTSSDFTAHANVFRLWLANEDASLPGEPTANLAALFSLDAWRPKGTPLRPCLTLDEAGRRLPVQVQVSLDSGGNWTQWIAEVEVLPDRAGVWLAAEALDPAFLAAARAGTARVRATGTLTGPDVVAAERWQGNPFALTWAQRDVVLGGHFAVRRVSDSSIHHAAVSAGLLRADERDDFRALEAVALRQARRAWAAPEQHLHLAGAVPNLRIGDWLGGDEGRRCSGQVRQWQVDLARGVTRVVLGGA